MTRHIAYRLSCTCPIYNRSMIPRDILESMGKIGFGSNPDDQFLHVAATSTFWTLSTEPKEVFDDAVQHLIAKQQEARREEAERMEHVFEEYRTTRKFDWDPAEFDFVGMDVTVDTEAYLRYLNVHLNEAASNHRSMVEHIQLEAIEVLPEADSKLLDRAVRFIKNADQYRMEIRALQNPKVVMDVQRNLANVAEYAKQRLAFYRMDSEQFVDVMGKALFDLEHYFPADFDGM
ncbi:hypothetical protein FDI21_gp267 [Pseudomonas phage Noxifer]|uniref:Uncharacterized protein n=1 Tax=Pseudomonas phage Noxifer TaxID=2006684 RepID=A0A1Y0SXT6_9CAUD|nr:hypothetical protein FDI21_gp267 [Pseudomonas phage Noxifer]ARV77444.1 hypothetical protein NOXIFER_279 [Pseudomonas phage Noxifer]